MAKWTSCKRKEFIRKLKQLGLSDPMPGGKHLFMRCGKYTLSMPSNSDYSVHQVKFLLREIEIAIGRKISLHDWESL